jgi:ABC-type multidrug transport system fused ATPase/permease subunit
LNEEKNRQLNNFIKATYAKNITIGESKVSNKIIDDESGTKQCFGVEFLNVSAKWAVSQANNTLENINLFTKPNRLIAIIGPVGAGKV